MAVVYHELLTFLGRSLYKSIREPPIVVVFSLVRESYQKKEIIPLLSTSVYTRRYGADDGVRPAPSILIRSLTIDTPWSL